MPAEPRSVSPLLQMLRNFLQGRKSENALRFADFIAARTQPPPTLPEGPSHKLAANYYYGRDGRREVKPPLVLAESRKQLEDNSSAGASASNPARKGAPKPSNIWQWD